MSDIPNCFYRISVKALILDDKKRFLLALEDNGFWELPGGGLDFGETVQDCITREVKEEMGLKVTKIRKQPSYFVTALNTDGRWKSNVIYDTTVKDLNFRPSEECVEIKFFTKAEAKKRKLHPVAHAFIKEYDPENHKP